MTKYRKLYVGGIGLLSYVNLYSRDSFFHTKDIARSYYLIGGKRAFQLRQKYRLMEPKVTPPPGKLFGDWIQHFLSRETRRMVVTDCRKTSHMAYEVTVAHWREDLDEVYSTMPKLHVTDATFKAVKISTRKQRVLELTPGSNDHFMGAMTIAAIFINWSSAYQFPYSCAFKIDQKYTPVATMFKDWINHFLRVVYESELVCRKCVRRGSVYYIGVDYIGLAELVEG